MIIEENEFFLLEEEYNSVYITVNKKGFPLLSMNRLLSSNPRINLTKFKELKDATHLANSSRVEIGDLKPEIEWSVSDDKMKAAIKINAKEEDVRQQYNHYVTIILDQLNTFGITEGIRIDAIQHGLCAAEEIIIAQGTTPIQGRDAVVAYYKRSERKPAIREDGKADYYDMNFLDEVKKGDWLGEKIPLTAGIPGKTITGQYVMAPAGKNKKLIYDRKTVGEYEEDGKVVLRALIDGVVEFQGGKIAVGNHLLIDGDVGVETGNVQFNGSITVTGTVMDGFSVWASNDLSILSELGVSNIEKIESQHGDVFIKGGIFGKNKSVIKAGKNIFIKHANESILEAGESIHIGYYSLGSRLKGKHIITDEQKGKLIGGTIEAIGKVKAAVIGNRVERKTSVSVGGFDRDQLKEELNRLLLEYKSKVQEAEGLQRKLDVFESYPHDLTEIQKTEFSKAGDNLYLAIAEIASMDHRRISIMDLLDTRGEGEVIIGLMAFPETTLQIKNMEKRLDKTTKGTFFAENNLIHFEY
ncbi:DUF342 domain-containing protein [Peribacillus glennii]|uniref:DUF342 domain-containing protein n=1 Tax=Peribacillus glennii TaxID=2303991 RepID=A0A372LI33_9BACI|nr:FapA family protein [Peribacillus glennii]RFU65644.1 DUF342 domain-containing protein [Peribacillus glennii]